MAFIHHYTFTCLFNENQHHYEYNFYYFSPSLLDKLLWKPFNEDAHASNLTFLAARPFPLETSFLIPRLRGRVDIPWHHDLF